MLLWLSPSCWDHPLSAGSMQLRSSSTTISTGHVRECLGCSYGTCSRCKSSTSLLARQLVECSFATYSNSNAQAMQHELEPWRIAALEGTYALNPGLVIASPVTAELHLHDQEALLICKSMEFHKLYHKCTGCTVTQHYKLAVCHTITKESDLWCPFCMFHKSIWHAFSKQIVHDSELKMMTVFKQMGIDSLVSWQVMSDFWKGCIDFWVRGYNKYVMADGSIHLTGGFWESKSKSLQRDIRFCCEALNNNAHALRVHPNDLCETGYLRVALHTTASSGLVMLSPSYASLRCRDEHGVLHSYQSMLYDELRLQSPHILMVRDVETGLLLFIKVRVATV